MKSPMKRLERERVLTQAEELSHLVSRKWSVKQRRMQRNRQRSWQMLQKTNIMEDKERKDLRMRSLFWMTENSQEKTLRIDNGYNRTNAIVAFPPEHSFAVSWRRKRDILRRMRKWKLKKQRLCVYKMCSTSLIMKKSWKSRGSRGRGYMTWGSFVLC